MAEFRGFPKPPIKYEELVTGRWYAYANDKGPCVFLASESKDTLLALVFRLDPAQPLITGIDLRDRGHTEMPYLDVSDRLIIARPPSGLPFDLPEASTAKDYLGAIVSHNDGSLNLLVKDDFGRVQSVDLSSGKVSESSQAQQTTTIWELRSRGNEEEVLVGRFSLKTADQR